MKVVKGEGTTESGGTGINIELTGDEVARAIDSFLVAKGVSVSGSRTIKINGKSSDHAIVSIFVDPSGFVTNKGKKISGRTGEKE